MKVLVAGGGVAALETVLALRAVGGPKLELELMSPEPVFVDRPASVAGAFGFGAAPPLDLARLAERESVTLHPKRLGAVRPAHHEVLADDGTALPYDILVVATGARPRAAVPGALTFTGPREVPALATLLDSAEQGRVAGITFCAATTATWLLPLYELAAMAAVELRDRGIDDTTVTVATPERHPLWMFGEAASRAVERLLADRGVTLRMGVRPVSAAAGGLLLADGETIPGSVVALPTLEGPRIAGLPSDARGFIPVDGHGRVRALRDVYAAGDVTSFPVKQGGLATQQADAVAAAIAAQAGALPEAAPFRPVLRGLLLTGGAPLYLRAELAPSGEVLRTAETPRTMEGQVSSRALWWPPGKVAGRYLAPYFATARPRSLAREPLRDRTLSAVTSPDDGRGDALALALLVATEDARAGDLAQALHALDAAAALGGGVLPEEFAARRAEWLAQLDPLAGA